METIVLERPGQLNLIDTAEPGQCGLDEAVVRVHRIGVCGTDFHAYRGKQPYFSYPRVLGHELGVEIVAIGDNAKNLRVGDWCAVEPYFNCGHCVACRRGKPNCCASLQVIGVHADGGMRESLKLPVDKLHPSKTLSLDQLALVETLGIGAHAVRRAQLEPQEIIAVIGTGPIGLAAIQFAQLAGARIIALDINNGRLEFCRQHFNVYRALDASITDARQLQNLLGDLPTTVFDATGNPQSMMRAFDYVAPGGKLVLVGLVQADITFHDPDFHCRELTILSSRNSTPSDFAHVIASMETGAANISPWITHRAHLKGMIDAFPHWMEPESGVVKAMVEL